MNVKPLATRPMAWSWRSGPPNEMSGSKLPSGLRRPNRLSRRWLLPPIAGGKSWQPRQATPVITGPSPEAASKLRRNMVSPSSNRAISGAPRSGKGSPNAFATTSCLPVFPARSVRSEDFPPQPASAKAIEAERGQGRMERRSVAQHGGSYQAAPLGEMDAPFAVLS